MKHKVFKKDDVLKIKDVHYTIRGLKSIIEHDELGNRIDTYYLKDNKTYKYLYIIDCDIFCGKTRDAYAELYKNDLYVYYDLLEQVHNFIDKWVVLINSEGRVNQVLKCTDVQKRSDGLYTFELKGENTTSYINSVSINPRDIFLADSDTIQIHSNYVAKRDAYNKYYNKYCEKLESYNLKQYEPYEEFNTEWIDKKIVNKKGEIFVIVGYACYDKDSIYIRDNENKIWVKDTNQLFNNYKWYPDNKIIGVKKDAN